LSNMWFGEVETGNVSKLASERFVESIRNMRKQLRVDHRKLLF
jgi:hypothetical protein